MYDQSFDASTTFARFVSTTNADRFETVVLPRREPGHVYTFGRHKSCDFILPGSRFSNIHFKVWETEVETSVYDNYSSVIMVEDTSTNGTFLNQARIGKGQTTVLANGDEIAAGVGVARDEVRYIVQLPKQSRPNIQSSMSPEAAACMQKYEIRQILGAGAFATVRCAINRSTGVKYAVKILNQRKLAITNANAKATELFKREIEILQSTRHPNIVQYVDMWADTSDIFLVLEYLPGGDLMDYIMRRGKLGELETVKIIQQVLEALLYCHKIGIAHRDIKPENILLTSDTPPIAKLTDFGLAKMVEPGSFLKTFCGTLTYVAPEVISMHGRIAGAYSTAVDMWSMGCVTFIMLAGSMPFVAEGQDAMMHAIQNGNYDDTALEDIELSGAGMDFIESLLRVNPEQRMSGQEALNHPWIRNIDYDQNFEGGIWSSQAQQTASSNIVPHLDDSGDSDMSAFAFDQRPGQVDSRPNTANGYGLRSESSYDCLPSGQISLQQYTNAQRMPGPGQFGIKEPALAGGWNDNSSHFSNASSSNYVVGSSQYVSASSQVEVGDSNATITPQRLKRPPQQQQQPVESKGHWHDNQNSSQKENQAIDPRRFQSEPIFRT